MSDAPMKLDSETRVYVRVALRDTLKAYELTDLLDVMADICQNNAEAARTGGRMGLPAEAWQQRADVLRQAADKLEGPAREEGRGGRGNEFFEGG